MSLDLGRVAYDAYRLRRGGVAYDGTAIPEWLALRPEIREAWIDAAAAVVGARSAPPAGAIDLDAARKAAREAQERAPSFAKYHTKSASHGGAGRDFHALAETFIGSDIPELAALVLAMADELGMLQAEATAERREINGLIEAHHDAVAQVEAAKIEVAALTAQRDEAQARVKRFEAFLPEVGYDPNDV